LNIEEAGQYIHDNSKNKFYICKHKSTPLILTAFTLIFQYFCANLNNIINYSIA
jgi:hypothetical protein